MGEFKSQLKTLIKKNSLLKGKSKIKFIGEIFAPMIVIGILIGLLYLAVIISFDYKEQYASGFTEKISKIYQLLVGTNGPLNTYQQRIVANLKYQIQLAHPDRTMEQIDGYFVEFTSEAELDEYYHDPENYRGVMGGLWFDDKNYGLWNPPSKLNYSIKVDSDYVNDNTIQIKDRSDSQIYLRHSFTQIQTAVDQAILMTQGFNLPILVTAQRFPDPYNILWKSWTEGRKMILKDTGGVFITAALFVGLFTMVTNMVMEKESKIFEGMKMMGLNSFAYYTSILITSCYTIIPSSAIVIGVLKGAQLIYTTQWYILTLLILTFSITLILMSFILSKFFDKSKFAGLVCFLIILIQSGIGIAANKLPIPISVKLLLCLISPAAISMANYSMVLKDLQAVKAEKNIDWSKIPNEYQVIGMLCLDIALYCIIIWYVDNVVSGEFGQSKPWYFFVTKRYWFKKSDKNKLFQQTRNYDNSYNFSSDSSMDSSSSNGSDIESPIISSNGRKYNSADFEVNEVSSNKSTVVIRNLRKEFKTGDGLRVAVDDLSIEMKQNQIHCFLGPNGSGKSTTIAMLSGLITCTSGTAYINGYDINQNIDMVRRSLGVCLQTDIIWDSLTVLEHLKFYASLKGYTDEDEAKREAKKMGIEVGLELKLNAPAGTLSGGQKRKLCLGIAFIGPRCDVVFLDEVSSGLDPLSRREVWDFLLSKKQGKTVILCTHYMDEAEALSNCVSIMANGVLKCNGSSLFLKNRFGVGYLLTCSKSSIANCDKQTVLEFIQHHLGNDQGVTILSDAGTELSFRLPMSSLPRFAEFFKHFEADKHQLSISHYGISVTTLEEVFLKIGNETLNSTPNFNDDSVRKALSTPSSGIKSTQQLKGLLIKRLHTTRKDLKSFMFSILIPLLILALGLVMYKNMRTIQTYNEVTTPLTFNIDVYGPDIYVPFSIDSIEQDLDVRIKNSLAKTNHTRLIPSDELEDYLVDNYESNPGAFFFDKREFNGQDMLHYRVYFNKDYLHALPIYINFVSNAIASNLQNGFLPPPNPYKMSPIGIQTTSRPFVHIKTKFELATVSVNFAAIIFFVMLTLASFSLVAASHAGNISFERASRVKRLLYISGLKKYVYWLSNLIWDITLTGVMVLFLAVMVVSIDDKFRAQFPLFISGIVLLVTSIIPLSYLISYKFTSHGKATGAIFGIHFGIGLLMTTGTFILRILTIKEDSDLYQQITDIVDLVFFALSPVYCFSKILSIITNFPGTTRIGQGYIDDYWGIHFGLTPILFLIGHTVIWTVWLLVLDYYPELKGRFRSKSKLTSSPSPPSDEDSDVSNERLRIRQLQTKDDPVRVENLSKLYPAAGKNKQHLAVANTTFSIARGVCFGLLGLNGAGKSTTLQILSADTQPSSGSVTINGYDVTTQRNDALKSIGSCFQFDALVGLLSAREQLYLYCRVKGVAEHLIPSTVESFIKMMDLVSISNSSVSGYSGGNKRKVSLSIACVGNPSVIFLDEVSCGVDVVVSRFMASVITELKKDKVIILCTHSLRECESVCDRLTIMKEGKLTCLGSIQHIKDKYGSGYSLNVKFKKQYLKTGVELLLKELPSASLIDHHDLTASFELSNSLENPIQLSLIFSIVQNKLKHILEDFSCSQTSMEQVFLKLTNVNQQKSLLKNQIQISLTNDNSKYNSNDDDYDDNFTIEMPPYQQKNKY